MLKRKRINKKKEKKYNVVDLFSGCGGLSEGFHKNGYKFLTHVEIDHHSCNSVRERLRHHGYKNHEISILEEDITKKNIIRKIKKEIKNKEIDLLLGGPPCQSFSSLGKAKDKDAMRGDPRNYLFENYEKILNDLKPKIFVFENVLGILSANLGNRKTIEVVKEKLGKNYYLPKDNKTMILNSAHYGVPQIRKRVILIGLRKDLSGDIEKIYENIIKTHYLPDESNEKKRGKRKYITVKEAIKNLPFLNAGEGEQEISFKPKKLNEFERKIRKKNDYILTCHVARKHNEIDMKRYYEMSKNNWSFKELLSKKPHLNHPNKRVFNNSYVVQEWHLPSRTIIAHLYKDGNQFIHPDPNQRRTLTPREAARLQSFSDDYFFSGPRTEQYKQIGNAVPPLMSEAIAKSVKKMLNILDKVQK